MKKKLIILASVIVIVILANIILQNHIKNMPTKISQSYIEHLKNDLEQYFDRVTIEVSSGSKTQINIEGYLSEVEHIDKAYCNNLAMQVLYEAYVVNNDEHVNRIFLAFTKDWMNDFGNVHDVSFYSFAIDREELNKINWENKDKIRVENICKKNTLMSDFR